MQGSQIEECALDKNAPDHLKKTKQKKHTTNLNSAGQEESAHYHLKLGNTQAFCATKQRLISGSMMRSHVFLDFLFKS